MLALTNCTDGAKERSRPTVTKMLATRYKR